MSRKSRISAETAQSIVTEFRGGVSVSQLAKLYGVQCSMIAYILKKGGLAAWPSGTPPTPMSDILKTQQEDVLAFYSDHSMRETGKHFGVSSATVLRFFQAIGLKAHALGRKPTRDPVSLDRWAEGKPKPRVRPADLRTTVHPTTKDILWLAGILEGEGHFAGGSGKAVYPRISLTMTDLDIVERAARLLDGKVFSRQGQHTTYKRLYNCRISGRDAIAWMMTLYPEMGTRRRQRIKEVIQEWKDNPWLPRGRTGQRLPAMCHPDRVRRAHGLCDACYDKSYQLKKKLAITDSASDQTRIETIQHSTE